MGFSIYCAFGKKGFGYEKDEQSIYVRLGFVVICFTKVDIEDILGGLLAELKEKDGQGNVESLKEEIDRLVTRLEEGLSESNNDKQYIDKLEDEMADLEDVVNENEELEKQVSSLKSEIEYIKVYFDLG